VQAAPSPVRQLFDQAFNHGNLNIVDELVSADLTAHMSSWGLPASRLGLKQMIANLRAAFPDLHCTIEDEIGEGDKIAAHWTIRGTHRGSLFGNLPTGRPVEVQGFIFARISAGRIVENWIMIDQMYMLQQLGIVPPPRGNS
jgi:steroid delta-isomerase-like uncharacterized protein